MTKRLTTTEINNRLKPKGIRLISEYNSSSKPSVLKCKNEHQWTTRVANLLNRGDGCPHCSGHSAIKQWTTETINLELSTRKIKLISNYPGKVKYSGQFACAAGHKWKTTIASVLSGKGCKVCYGKTIPLTLREIRRRYKKLGYTVRGKYTNYSSLLTFNCKEGHSWNAPAGNTRCSSCAAYGFSLDRPSFGYILKFDSFIKFGITNSLESRLYRHRLKNPPHVVSSILKFSSGKKAKLWENYIKKTFGKKYVSKKECPDGWTETLPIELLDKITQKYDGSSHHKF